MKENVAELEVAAAMLSQALAARKEPPASADIIRLIEQFKPAFPHFTKDDFSRLLEHMEMRHVTSMGVGVSLIDKDAAHDEEWSEKRDITWNAWNDYEQYLVNQGWSARVISSMDTITGKILGLLQDPESEGEWYRRGLVIGHVQSGKTANYIGLLSKAADAGYKFIIVIAGIHNNLRTQTQQRVDEGFIGRDSKTRSPIGVGLINRNKRKAVTVTTTESDFNGAMAKSYGMELRDLNNTFILVIKKNVNTLGNLYNWLKDLNAKEGDKITDIPMLLIDDEADNASINTSKTDTDPTRTNKEIRNILNLFKKRSYVGYTATPFANIFINPQSESEMLGEDLFPKDFIYCLDAPNNYFGSERIFLGAEDNSNYLRDIEDMEDVLPLRHKKDHEPEELPASLIEAIQLFVLARAIRNMRGQKKKHSSMMVNVSRFVGVQKQVAQLIRMYMGNLQNAIHFNYRKPAGKALDDPQLNALHGLFLEEYAGCGFKWEEVLENLDEAASAVKVFVVNSKSDEALDYAAYSESGEALTAIAIGGLSLSRGLTIEGLTTSYIYRNSKMYDTLMQMGRWFGYRDNYEDLCRIYMSDESRGWYTHIAEATEELRMQILRMRREGKKPTDFGLYVRAHPDTLIVTALNKMQHAESLAFKVSYDGKLKESHKIPADTEKNEQNRKLLLGCFDELCKITKPENFSGSYIFRNIRWDYIQDIVNRFRFHKDLTDMSEQVPLFIKEISDLYPDWDVVFNSKSGELPRDGELLSAQYRSIGRDESGPKKTLEEKGWHVGNKQKFSSNSSYSIGLSTEQLDAARMKKKNPDVADYTDARGKPVLMLHLLTLQDGKTEEAKKEIMRAVPALSVSFPHMGEFRTVECVVNPVWLKRLKEDSVMADDEEDHELS